MRVDRPREGGVADRGQVQDLFWRQRGLIGLQGLSNGQRVAPFAERRWRPGRMGEGQEMQHSIYDARRRRLDERGVRAEAQTGEASPRGQLRSWMRK